MLQAVFSCEPSRMPRAGLPPQFPHPLAPHQSNARRNDGRHKSNAEIQPEYLPRFFIYMELMSVLFVELRGQHVRIVVRPEDPILRARRNQKTPHRPLRHNHRCQESPAYHRCLKPLRPRAEPVQQDVHRQGSGNHQQRKPQRHQVCNARVHRPQLRLRGHQRHQPFRRQPQRGVHPRRHRACPAVSRRPRQPNKDHRNSQRNRAVKNPAVHQRMVGVLHDEHHVDDQQQAAHVQERVIQPVAKLALRAVHQRGNQDQPAKPQHENPRTQHHVRRADNLHVQPERVVPPVVKGRRGPESVAPNGHVPGNIPVEPRRDRGHGNRRSPGIPGNSTASLGCWRDGLLHAARSLTKPSRPGNPPPRSRALRFQSFRSTASTKVLSPGTLEPFPSHPALLHASPYPARAAQSGVRSRPMQLGRYEILETIGQGASSSVSKARDTLIGRTVALKILHTGFHGSEWRDRFLREAHIVGQLSHPRIVNIYDAGIDEASGAPFLVMEFIIGHTLEEILVEGTPLPDRLFSWGIGLARALDYAHSQGVIHGDVKPANVLINEDGRVKLTDFGIARLATQATHSGRLMGTPAYLAPEQIEGRGADARSDLFSLGIILYQLATGHRPFQGDSLPAVCAQILKAVPAPPSRLNPLLPRQLDGALARCLAKDPARRFARAEELAAELESIAAPASATVTTARRKKSAPFLRGYVFASSLAILALSVSLVRGYARNVLRVPPPPAAVFAEPRPPSEFPSTAVPIPAEDLSSKEASHALPASRKSPGKTRRQSV